MTLLIEHYECRKNGWNQDLFFFCFFLLLSCIWFFCIFPIPSFLLFPFNCFFFIFRGPLFLCFDYYSLCFLMLHHDNSQTVWISAECPFCVDLREHYLPITIKQCKGHEYFVHLTECSCQASNDILKDLHIRKQERDLKLFVKGKHSLKWVKQGIPSLFSVVSQVKNLRYSRGISFGCSFMKPFLPNVFSCVA